ncbi:hypothetical protein VDGL01_12099 [Verticillium dahliae]
MLSNTVPPSEKGQFRTTPNQHFVPISSFLTEKVPEDEEEASSAPDLETLKQRPICCDSCRTSRVAGDVTDKQRSHRTDFLEPSRTIRTKLKSLSHVSSTTASITKLGVERRPADNAEKLSREIDTALPGKHTRELCDKLSHERDDGTLLR